MASTRRILVTGLGGAVGAGIRPALEQRYQLSTLSRSGVAGIPPEKNFRADISNLEAITPAFEGIDSVVHLAAYGGINSPLGMVDAPWEEIVRNNIEGTRNVFEASSRAGVRRIVFASSGATVGGYQKDPPYSNITYGNHDQVPSEWHMLHTSDEPRPLNLYAVSKLFGEDLARFYVETTPLSILCIRIGACPASGRPRPNDHWGQAIFVSHNDAADLIVRSIEASDDLRYDIFFGISNNRWRFRDFSHSTDLLGHVPQDAAEDFIDEDNHKGAE
jgi:NAD+ dependent glucose-6-phosphate dehydrogenase